MEDRLTFRVRAINGGAHIGVSVRLPADRTFMVAQPRETFNRHECKAALKQWVAERQVESARG